MLSIDTNTAPKISPDLKISYKIMAQAVSADPKQNFALKEGPRGLQDTSQI